MTALMCVEPTLENVTNLLDSDTMDCIFYIICDFEIWAIVGNSHLMSKQNDCILYFVLK